MSKRPYIPGSVPYSKDIEDVTTWVQRELENIRTTLSLVNQYNKLYAAPTKPQDGQTEYADGTTWNPGSGEGIYTYYNNTWNKLG